MKMRNEESIRRWEIAMAQSVRRPPIIPHFAQPQTPIMEQWCPVRDLPRIQSGQSTKSGDARA